MQGGEDTLREERHKENSDHLEPCKRQKIGFEEVRRRKNAIK